MLTGEEWGGLMVPGRGISSTLVNGDLGGDVSAGSVSLNLFVRSKMAPWQLPGVVEKVVPGWESTFLHCQCVFIKLPLAAAAR